MIDSLGKKNILTIFSLFLAVLILGILTKLTLFKTIFLICLIMILSPFNKKSSFKTYQYVFSGLLAILFALGNQIHFTFVSAFPKDNYIQNNFVKMFLVFICAFFIIAFILNCLDCLINTKEIFTEKKKCNIFFLNNPIIVFLLLLVFWGPYLLSLYPGTVLPDSLSSINQALGNQQLSNHHPIVFTLFLRFFIRTFSFLGLNKSIFIYTLTQTTIVAGILTYFIFWLKKYSISSYMRLLFLSYFAFAPVFPIYALNVQKDTLFSSYLFLFSLKCIDVIVAKKQSNWMMATLVISGVLATFYRNNGLYIVFIMMIVLSVVLIRKKKYCQSISIFGAYFAITFLMINPLISKYSVPTAMAESFGVPLQQVSRTVVLKGDIGKEDKKYLNQLLPISEYEKYSPMLADSIKWNPKFNNRLLNDEPLRFIKVWARLLPKNFKTYIDAYLLNTYGFWAPFEKNYYGFLDTRVQNNDLKIKQVDLIKLATGSNVMQQVINKRNFFGSGTLLCLMIIGFYIYWIQKRKILWIGYLPSFLTWLSIMVATPVAFSLRYVFILAISLPLFFCLPFLKLKAS
ncbi:DUF6020 family protein [Enterococcus raffinosus]|uniref:DUF6020 family protein n=1 Tax=Enterococcus raffinosus TaxID=71452 RepID=UPI000763D8C3|nr:DUF6020 family protein [Enterococcus raffinosus]